MIEAISYCIEFTDMKFSLLSVSGFKGYCSIDFKSIKNKNMAQPIPPITLPPAENPEQEGEWLQQRLRSFLDEEFIPESINQTIAERAAQIFVRQRMEGENDLGELVLAIVTEMKAFDFSESFYGEFAIANAVSDLLLESLGIDKCCGQ